MSTSLERGWERWACIVLAHHPPCQLDRAFHFRLFGVWLPLCTRCLGQWFGYALGAVVFMGGADTISRWQAVAAISLLPLPALADWTTQTLGWRYSNNPLRVLTGLAFGVAVVGFASLALHGHLKEAVLVALWYILLAVSACSVLNRAGCIEPLLRPYVDFLDGRVG